MWRLRQGLLLLLLFFSLAQAGPLRGQLVCPNEVRPHSRPYMAALKDSEGDYVCGGFLVGQQWVMTSGRCQHFDEVVLGAYDLNSVKEAHRVASVHRHPDYKFQNNTFSNDILLVKLHSEVHLNEYVDILALPPPDSDLPVGTPCSVAGWGLNQLGGCPQRVHEAHVNLYNHSKCRKFYPKIDYGKICAGERENCQAFDQGEMGDPLVCNGVVRGILSYSNPCPPAVYTDISKYLPWIEKIMSG